MAHVIKSVAAVVGFVAAAASPALAADLGGSMKDGNYRGQSQSYEAPSAGYASPSKCYLRADVGYSWSKNPSIQSPFGTQTNYFVDDGTGNGTYVPDTTRGGYVQNGTGVSDTSMANSWLGEAGFGCGTGGPRGIRGEMMFGYRGDRKIQGTPGDFKTVNVYDNVPNAPIVAEDDPLHATIKTYTMMFNAYKDLGQFGNITPYVGAGVGLAYNRMSDVVFTDASGAKIDFRQGHDDLALAWSLMAGLGIQVSDRAVVDVGYRYMNTGKSMSGDVNEYRANAPRVRIDDLAAHELKVGLRYSFGGHAEAPSYAPMK
jgi:opacity protein-like surface antigen